MGGRVDVGECEAVVPREERGRGCESEGICDSESTLLFAPCTTCKCRYGSSVLLTTGISS